MKAALNNLAQAIESVRILSAMITIFWHL